MMAEDPFMSLICRRPGVKLAIRNLLTMRLLARVEGENVDFQIFAKFLVRFSEVTKRRKFGVRQNLRITRFKRKCFRPNPTAS